MEKACERCGMRFTASHGLTRYCSPTCRNSSKGYWSRRAPCTVCGELAWKSPSGDAPTHKKCAPKHRGVALGVGTPCEVCGSPTNPRQKRRFCSGTCAGKADSARRLALRGEGATTHARRVDREAAAAGLRPSDRKRLRQKWKRQARTCAYCPAPATTIDHVIPLIRGGTNYEGNLVPCCLSCNSRKSDRLVIEFRLGLRASQTYTPFRERPKIEPRPEPVKHTYTHTCMVCDRAFTSGRSSRMTCGAEHCLREWTGRCARDSYRRSVGLPVDPRRPTVYWLRLIDAA